MYESQLGDIIIVVVFIATIIFEVVAKRKTPKGQISEESLNSSEKTITWILCIFNPVLAGAILYYGWKKGMPNKAKEANNISMKAFLIGIVFFGILFTFGLI